MSPMRMVRDSTTEVRLLERGDKSGSGSWLDVTETPADIQIGSPYRDVLSSPWYTLHMRNAIRVPIQAMVATTTSHSPITCQLRPCIRSDQVQEAMVDGCARTLLARW